MTLKIPRVLSLPAITVAVFIVSSLLWNAVQGIKCYECLERPKSDEKHLACSYFDKSSQFQTNCEHSTFCMKRVSKLKLNNGTVVTITMHKCADQSQKTVIEDEETGKWNWGKIVHEYIYDDGCYPHPANFMLTTETLNCFCSTDYCNSSTKSVNSFAAIAVLVASVLVRWITCS